MIKFCSKCHKEVYTMIESGNQIIVKQHGRNVLSLGKGSVVSMNLQCSSGHNTIFMIGIPDRKEDNTQPDRPIVDSPEAIKQHIDSAIRSN
jgi:hypothetical protein